MIQDEEDIVLDEQNEEPINVEVIQPADEIQADEEPIQEEADDFFSNIAETLDDTILSRLASELITDFKKDKEPIVTGKQNRQLLLV